MNAMPTEIQQHLSKQFREEMKTIIPTLVDEVKRRLNNEPKEDEVTVDPKEDLNDFSILEPGVEATEDEAKEVGNDAADK